MATKPVKEEATTAGLTSFAAFDLAQKLLIAACGPVPSITIMQGKGNKLFIGAVLNGSEAIITVVGEIHGLDGPLTVPADQFLSALKGRKEGTLTLKGNVLHIKSGNYRAEINTTESQGIEPIDVPTGEDVQSFTVTPSLHQFLSNKLPQIRIERVHPNQPDVMLNIRATAKKRYMATYDPHQLCFLTSAVKGEDDAEAFSLLMPYSRFASFIKDLPVANCHIYVSDTAMVAMSKQFRVKLALPHIEPGSFNDPDAVYAKAKEVVGVQGEAFSIGVEQLQGFLENSRTLVSVGTEVSFTPAKGGMTLKVLSQAGSTQLLVKGSTIAEPFGLDHRFVQTLMMKQQTTAKKVDEDSVNEVSFELIDNTFVLCRANVTYLALLNAAPAPEEKKGGKKAADEE